MVITNLTMSSEQPINPLDRLIQNIFKTEFFNDGLPSVRTANDTSSLLDADWCLLAYCSIYNAQTYHAIPTLSSVLLSISYSARH